MICVKLLFVIYLLGLTEMGFWSSRKLKVNVDGMSLNNCQRVYNLENVEISNKQICAGGEFGYDSW